MSSKPFDISSSAFSRFVHTKNEFVSLNICGTPLTLPLVLFKSFSTELKKWFKHGKEPFPFDPHKFPKSVDSDSLIRSGSILEKLFIGTPSVTEGFILMQKLHTLILRKIITSFQKNSEELRALSI
jgi:hypothetical protein